MFHFDILFKSLFITYCSAIVSTSRPRSYSGRILNTNLSSMLNVSIPIINVIEICNMDRSFVRKRKLFFYRKRVSTTTEYKIYGLIQS